jgi:hypothetical protein
VRTEHLVAAAGFDPRFRRGEDIELACRLERLGMRFVFEPRATGTHIARRTFRSWAAAAREYGRTEVAMGPVWDVRGLVDVKVSEFPLRHPVVQRIVRLGLAHPRVAPALLAAGRIAGRTFTIAGLWKLARGVYTAIFELEYWRGVEDAVGTPGLVLRWIRGNGLEVSAVADR